MLCLRFCLFWHIGKHLKQAFFCRDMSQDFLLIFFMGPFTHLLKYFHMWSRIHEYFRICEELSCVNDTAKSNILNFYF